MYIYTSINACIYLYKHIRIPFGSVGLDMPRASGGRQCTSSRHISNIHIHIHLYMDIPFGSVGLDMPLERLAGDNARLLGERARDINSVS